MGERKAGRFHLLMSAGTISNPCREAPFSKACTGGPGARPMPGCRPPSAPERRSGCWTVAGQRLGRCPRLRPLPLLPGGLPGPWFGYPPLLSGREGQKPTQGPRCVTGLPVGLSMRRERRRRGGEDRLGGEGVCRRVGNQRSEQLSGLSQAGAGLGVGGTGSGAKDG